MTLSVIAADGGLSANQTFFVAIAITLACAWLSWHYVEQPCLRLKTRFQMRRR